MKQSILLQQAAQTLWLAEVEKRIGLVRNEAYSVVMVTISSRVAGFEKPSAIQQRAIKQIIKGRDVIAQ